MTFIDKVITFVIAVTLIPTVVEAVEGLTGTGMALEGTSAGTLLGLAPLLFVAAVIIMFYRKSRG
jgi:hypothetical protein